MAVMKVTGIIRNEESDKTGVGVISISDHLSCKKGKLECVFELNKTKYSS